jgi:hypothetical protein
VYDVLEIVPCVVKVQKVLDFEGVQKTFDQDEKLSFNSKISRMFNLLMTTFLQSFVMTHPRKNGINLLC